MNDINLAVPFFSQRNIKYEWKNENDETEKFYIAAVACNITSLCMILNYLGVTQDTPNTMANKVFAHFTCWNKIHKGYDNLTIWINLKRIVNEIYGIDEKYIIDLRNTSIIQDVEKYLKRGFPIAFSIGTLKHYEDVTTGHIVVLRGIQKEKYYVINDPWGDPTNAFAELKTSKTKNRGLYVAKTENEDILYGKGIGDNCIIQKDNFLKATGNVNQNERVFNGSLTVLHSGCYFFPLEIKKTNETQLLSKVVYSEYTNKMNLLLTENGKSISGLALKKVKGQNIHSIGPGRIVAIRNTKNEHDNFILVRYAYPGKDGKYFFVNYKYLSYVDMNSLMHERIFDIQSEKIDVFSQIIRKIRPKYGIYDKGEITGEKHPYINIPERGFVSFYPIDEKIVNYIKDPNNDSYTPYDVNDINSYKIKENGKWFYQISKSGEKIPTDYIIPQSINYREYNYYRNKLKKLINGEVVIFCDEDYKNNIQNNKVNEKNYKEYFISEIKTAFYEIDFNKEEYESALGKVEDYYKKQLKELEEKGIEEKKEKLFYIREEFTSRCKRLCKALLEMPWEEQEWGFTLNDKWFKGGDIRDENGKIIGKFKCLKDIYNNINKLFEKIMEELNYSNSEIREAWESFEKNVNMFYPANIDYFLEVSPNSILGICSNITEIDCFSVKNLFPEKQEIKLESLSKKENIKVLLEKGILNEKDFSIEENYLTSHDVENMMNNIFDRMKGFVLKDKNYFNYSSKEMKNNIKKVIGYTMRDESYQDKMKKEIKLSKKIKEIIKKTFNLNIDLEVFYYNIIDVLDDVRKKQEEIVQGLIK